VQKTVTNKHFTWAQQNWNRFEGGWNCALVL